LLTAAFLMSTFVVTPPAGFQLEHDDAEAVKPPAGFQLEQNTRIPRVTPPEGFQLEQSTSKVRVTPPAGFRLEEPTQVHPPAGFQLETPSSPMQSGRRLTPAVSPIQHAAKFVFGPAQKSRTDAGTATLDAFKNFRAQFLNSDETLGAEKPTPANTKRLVQSDHRSWANAKKSLPPAVEAICPSDLVGVAYPQTGMVATGQPVSPPSPPAATEPPVDPRFPYGKKIVNTPQGPITVPLPRPSWKFISYEPDPR